MNNNKTKNAKKKPQKSTLDELAKSMREHQQAVAEGREQPYQRPSEKVAAKAASAKKKGKKPLLGSKPSQKKTQKPSADNPEGASVRPQQPTKPVSGKTRKAYNKAVSSRTQKSKKRGSRGGNYILYYLLIAVVVIVVFVILAKTLLFNCGSILVEGNERYTTEQIVELAGIKNGESLLDINTKSAEERIVAALPYIDMAEVVKSYPSTIKIKITEAERWFMMKQDGKTYIVSRLGKVIDEGTDRRLPMVIGYEAVEPAVGGFIKSFIETKTDIPSSLLTAAEEAGLSDITTIDISDRFDITVEVEGRVTLKLGNINQLETKLHIADELIENEISATQSVTVDLTDTDKVYVRDNNVIDNPNLVPELPPQEIPEGTAEASAEGTAQAAE